MKKGVLKLAAYCMAGVMMIGNTGLNALAVGLDSSLAGAGAAVAESQKEKAAAGVVKVAPGEYDTIAIARVNEYVNIRDAASTETGKVVGKIYNNCKAEILGKTDSGWYLIESGGVTGYVAAHYFVTGEAARELATEVGTAVAVVKEGTETLMVRSSADSNSEAISMVGDYEKLQVLEEQDDWVKVAVDDDVVGYVSKAYVDCNTEFNEAESVEEVAARQEAIKDAYEKAIEMQQAAYDAMNAADGDEAAYAASQANAALAEAMMLASEQEFDYEAMDLAAEIAAVAQDTAVAAVWAQEAEDEYARIAAEEAAQAQAEAEYLAYLESLQSSTGTQSSTGSAGTTGSTVEQKEQAAAEAWQAAVDAQREADKNWTEEAQAKADAVAQAAMQAAKEAEEARQQAAQQQSQQTQQQAPQQSQQQTQQQAPQQSQQQTQQQAPQQSQQQSSNNTSSNNTGSNASSVRQSVVSYALQFVGNPYVYGGNSLTNGIDCSGFTQQVLGHFGVSLPRTAASQANYGYAVSMDNLQPGDLLFYSSGYGIGHVSIYIGNGQVVHASNPTSGIIISSVNYRTPCAARSFF